MNRSAEDSHCGDCRGSMEQRLANLGASIDELVVKAQTAKEELKVRFQEFEHAGEEAVERGNQAVAQIKSALEIAQQDIHEAWLAVRDGGQRAAQDLLGKEKPRCQGHVHCTTHRKEFASKGEGAGDDNPLI